VAAILIIDDDPQIGALLRQMLAIEGFDDILVAANGKQAMELFQNHDVRLIVTDILMPDMDGMEVILKIRVEQKKPVPMIAISGGGTFSRAGEVLSWARDLGIHHAFTKPIDRAAFVAKVRELIQK